MQRPAYPAEPLRSPRLCESLITRGILLFLAKPLRSQRPAYPCGAFAPSAPLREPHYSRDTFFLAKPQRSQRPIYPRGIFASFAPLRETFFQRNIFSRQAAKIAKPCIPLRSLCALRAFARELLLLARILLAKPQRSQRPAYPCEAFAFSARLREKKSSCERYYFLAGVFSRQAAKIAKPYIPPRNLCVLRAFAREKNIMREIKFPCGSLFSPSRKDR